MNCRICGIAVPPKFHLCPDCARLSKHPPADVYWRYRGPDDNPLYRRGYDYAVSVIFDDIRQKRAKLAWFEVRE